MKARMFRAKCLALSLALSLLSGCTQLPDLKPFADATSAMAAAMRQGYAQTEGLLVRTGAGDARVRQLRDRWEPTRKAVTAVVAYSDALAALGDAGNKGEESAGALISSLEGVEQSVGALLPGLPGIPSTIVTAFRKINGVVARIRARRALKEIVSEADESLSAAATILSMNFRNLSEIYQASAEELRNKLESDNFELRSYHDGLAAEMKQITLILTGLLDYQNKDKEAARGSTLAALRAADKDLASELDARLSALSPDATATQKDAITLTVLRKRQGEWDARVKYLQGELNRTAPGYEAFTAQRAALRDLKNANALAFSGTVIETWAATHSNLRSALTKRQRVTVSELTSVVNELTEIARSVGKEKTNGND